MSLLQFHRVCIVHPVSLLHWPDVLGHLKMQIYIMTKSQHLLGFYWICGTVLQRRDKHSLMYRILCARSDVPSGYLWESLLRTASSALMSWCLAGVFCFFVFFTAKQVQSAEESPQGRDGKDGICRTNHRWFLKTANPQFKNGLQNCFMLQLQPVTVGRLMINDTKRPRQQKPWLITSIKYLWIPF